MNPDIWHLTDFLTEDRVLFLNKEDSWEEAIRKVSEPLLKRESMEELYVKCIIERLKEAGPYMFVTPDLILGTCPTGKWGPASGFFHWNCTGWH